jgi:OmpA-OmpF porin, OOP family
MAIKRITALTAVAFVLGISTSIAQAADEGGYFGIGLGQSKDKDFCSNFASGVSCDDKDTGIKLFGGYQFNPNGAIELGYVDLGKAKASVPGQSAEAKAHGFDLGFVGTLPINDQFAVLARVGLFFWKAELSVTGVGSDSASGNDLTYGLGVKYDVSRNVSVRFEWQQFKDVGDNNSTGQSDVDLLFASMVFRIK